MCLSPITVRVEKSLYKDSKTKMVSYQRVPCGKCPECRNLRRLQWTFRLEQESLQHGYNYFVTLTYSDKFIPNDRQIYKPDFTAFVKRLRSRLSRLYGDKAKFKYFGCGEYGDTFGRCHFHCIIFSDVPISYDDIRLNWTYGFVKFDPFTSRRAAYVVKYSQKQLFIDYPEGVQPPCSFTSLSLGKCWLTPSIKALYKSSLLTTCFTLNGTKVPLPRFYYTRIFNSTERMFLAQKAQDDHYKQYMKDISNFGLKGASSAQFSKFDSKWQNAFDNFINKPQYDFHYGEEEI